MMGTAAVIRAEARSLPLPDDSVDLVVTSPPYFALRSYQDGGEHYHGQIGSEASPSEFLDALLDVTRECVRVLKPSGSLWVNLGDKYAGGGGGGTGSSDGVTGRADRPSRREYEGLRAKSLMGIPWRYALRCIDDVGLILRAEVIWSKPNGMPESVTDRVRRSHEQWFHFTLKPRYYSAVDEIRDAIKPGQSRAALSFARNGRGTAPGQSEAPHRLGRDDQGAHHLGKLPGSVWTIPTEPLRVPDHLDIDHDAAFPTEWPKRIIQGWSPAGVCVACGEGRRPVSVPDRSRVDQGAATRKAAKRVTAAGGTVSGGTARSSLGESVSYAITGYACACPAPTIRQEVTEYDYDTDATVTRTVEVPDPSWVNPAPTTPGVVLDPFGGTGTTALVAKALGRHGITVDMSADYCRLAQWRTNDRDQLAKVLGIGKSEAPTQDESLLDLLEDGA